MLLVLTDGGVMRTLVIALVLCPAAYSQTSSGTTSLSTGSASATRDPHPQSITLVASAAPPAVPVVKPAPSSGSIMPIVKVASPPAMTSPVQPVVRPHPTAAWFGLAATAHASAAFDAWTTRQAISHGATEMNPTLKPFANSGALYPALQVGPAAMDYLSL